MSYEGNGSNPSSFITHRTPNYFKHHHKVNMKLKKMFAEFRANNHSMYDGYFRVKTGKSHTQLFEDHSKRFKQVLDQLISEKKPKLHNRHATKMFVQRDLEALFTRPYSAKRRQIYYKEISPEFPEIPRITEYKSALNTIGEPTQNIINASDYFHTNAH